MASTKRVQQRHRTSSARKRHVRIEYPEARVALSSYLSGSGPQTALADYFGVSQSTISRITTRIHRHTRRHG